MANWLPYERCSRPRSETLIWYSWVIRSYIHLYGLEISIKASRRVAEAPCEAFNLMYILELPIVGHIKPSRLNIDTRYFDQIPHYNDIIMSAIASQTTGVSIVYLIVCSGVNQRKHQSYTSLAFVRGIHQWPVNSPHKIPVTRKLLPFDDVIMQIRLNHICSYLHSHLSDHKKLPISNPQDISVIGSVFCQL